MHNDDRIERYILGQMSEAEAQEFEAYFLNKPECIEQLELAEKLHQGMLDIQHDPLFAQTAQLRAKRAWFAMPVPLWSVAAAVVLAIVLPSTFLPSSDVPQAVNVVSLELDSTRGETTSVLELNASAQQTLLSIFIDTDVPTFDYSAFAFTLTDAQGVQVFSQSDLTLNNVSTLHINLGQNVLPPGRYRYQLLGISPESQRSLQTGDVLIN